MPTKDELLQEAKDAGVQGADDMTKAELEEALKEPEQAKNAMAGQSDPYNPQRRRHDNLAS